jgi:pyruvate carboxylase
MTCGVQELQGLTVLYCVVLGCGVLLAQGVSTHIKLKAAGELQESGKREVYFEANGVPRVVEVVDKKSTEVLGKAAIREKVRLEPTSSALVGLGVCLC